MGFLLLHRTPALLQDTVASAAGYGLKTAAPKACAAESQQRFLPYGSLGGMHGHSFVKR